VHRAARRSRSRVLLLAGGLAVSAFFAYLAVRNVDFGEVGHALAESNYWWLVPAFVVLAACVAVRAWRWQVMFARRTRPPIRAVASAMLVGLFFNNVLPARAGEAARIVALNQRARTSRVEAAGTVVLERAYDVLCLLVLLFVLVPWLPRVTWLRPAAGLAIGVAAALAVAFVVLGRFGDRPLRAALRPLARLRFVGAGRAELAAGNLVQGLAALRDWRLAAAGLALTMLSWLLLGLSMWLAMLGFDLGLSPVAGLLVAIAVNVAMILPSSPAAVGVFEASTLVALNAYGVPKEQALGYALVLHALNFVPFIVVGFLVLHAHAAALRRTAAAGTAQ
jgi:uncharacterized membrane protein YbhN (UPF0104 family)